MGTGLRRAALAQAPATPVYLQHKAALCLLLGLCKVHKSNISSQWRNVHAGEYLEVSCLAAAWRLPQVEEQTSSNTTDGTFLHYEPCDAQ